MRIAEQKRLAAGSVFSTLVAALAFALGLSGPAVAQTPWKPDKVVELVIGTGPGGSFDTTARVLQRIWKDAALMPAPTVVLNKPGAGQTLALAYLNQHAGDGHYLSIASGIIFSNELTGKTKFAYTDFTPVALLFSEPTVFAVNAASPLGNARDLVAWLRKDPAGPSFAVGSTLGSVVHIAGALVVKSTGGDIRKMKAVVFNSSADSVTAVLGGHVDVAISAASLVLPQAQAGKLRMIAVASAQRIPGPLAEVPTLKEQGIDAVATNWRGVLGPKGMTNEQLSYWNDVMAKTVNSKEWQALKTKNVWEETFMTSRDFKAFLDADYAATKTVLTELGLAR